VQRKPPPMPPRFELFKIWLLDPRTLRGIGRFKVTRRSLLASIVGVWMLYAGVMWQLGEQPRRNCVTAACRALLGGQPFGGPPAISLGPTADPGTTGSGPGGRPTGAPPATVGGPGSGSAPASGPTTTSGGPLATGATPSTAPGPVPTSVPPTTMGGPGATAPTPEATTTTTASPTTTTAPDDCKKKDKKTCNCEKETKQCDGDEPPVAPGG